MPSSQTKISQHFSPRAPRAGPSSATGPTRRAASIKSRDDTSDNSEGSEGLNAIHLASDRRPCNPEALPMSQKRARRKAVLDSEDEDDGIAQDASRRQKLGAALSRSRSPTRPEITLEENRGDSDPAALYAADKTSPTLRRSGRTRRPPTEPSVRPPRKARPPPLSGILASGTRTIRTQSSAPTSRSSFHIEVPTLSEEVKSSYRCFPSPPCNASAKPTTAVRPSDPEQRRPHRAPSAKSDSDDQPILIVSSSESEKPRSHQKGDPNARSAEAKEKRSVQKSGRKRVTAKVRSGGQSRTKRHDPDEEEDAATEEEVDIAGELAMDEPERFKSDSRLRKRRETSVQRRIRKLKNQRLGIVESWSSESESSSEATYTSDSAPDTDEEENWIVEDGGVVGEGLLPHEFSFNSIQTPEFKFKVVFHYFLLLVIKGPGILPLKGDTAEYLLPQLRDLRRRLEGFKNSRVRSQIWRTDFVRALEAFPVFETEHLDIAEEGCDACHIGGRRSRYRVHLEGDEYDKETFAPLDSGSESESDSEGSLPRDFLMGRFCKARAEVYHKMSHWDEALFTRIRNYYRDLLRAKFKPVPDDSDADTSNTDSESDREETMRRREHRANRRKQTEDRVERLRRRPLPDAYRDVDVVLEWMDAKGYQQKQFNWLENMIEQSRRLEFDNSKDQ